MGNLCYVMDSNNEKAPQKTLFLKGNKSKESTSSNHSPHPD